jgi:6-pyruvoyltetrahydropterin/6-carboxytetrahydropterin synthase
MRATPQCPRALQLAWGSWQCNIMSQAKVSLPQTLALDGQAFACQTPHMIEITQEFGFDAAHFLDAGAAENRRVHGHSFYVEVTLSGEPDPSTGILRDLGEVKTALGDIGETLDHRLLNEIEELGPPTLENLARYIFRRAKEKLPQVSRVRIRRPSYGQSCTYEER